jgi:hypothetical protein
MARIDRTSSTATPCSISAATWRAVNVFDQEQQRLIAGQCQKGLQHGLEQLRAWIVGGRGLIGCRLFNRARSFGHKPRQHHTMRRRKLDILEDVCGSSQ